MLSAVGTNEGRETGGIVFRSTILHFMCTTTTSLYASEPIHGMTASTLAISCDTPVINCLRVKVRHESENKNASILACSVPAMSRQGAGTKPRVLEKKGERALARVR